jgi:hypothetical protein
MDELVAVRLLEPSWLHEVRRRIVAKVQKRSVLTNFYLKTLALPRLRSQG